MMSSDGSGDPLPHPIEIDATWIDTEIDAPFFVESMYVSEDGETQIRVAYPDADSQLVTVDDFVERVESDEIEPA